MDVRAAGTGVPTPHVSGLRLGWQGYGASKRKRSVATTTTSATAMRRRQCSVRRSAWHAPAAASSALGRVASAAATPKTAKGVARPLRVPTSPSGARRARRATPDASTCCTSAPVNPTLPFDDQSLPCLALTPPSLASYPSPRWPRLRCWQRPIERQASEAINRTSPSTNRTTDSVSGRGDRPLRRMHASDCCDR